MHSTVEFKYPRADLHRWSKWIFMGSFFISLILTLSILLLRLPEPAVIEKTTPPPVIITLTQIPQTRQRVVVSAPPFPFDPSGIPIEVEDDIMPDDITIEDTNITPDMPISAPQIYVPTVDAGSVENEIYEYFSVEEVPRRISGVVPKYPPIASRAGIEGAVSLKVLVNTEGSVDSVIVIDGPELFRDSAIEAAEKTEFVPARQNDHPVACWVILPFRFTLNK